MKIIIRSLILLSLVILISIVGVSYQLNKQINSPLSLTEQAFIKIERGETLHRFSKELKNKGWIDTRFWIRLYVWFNPSYAALKKGTYLVTPKDTLKSLLEKIIQAKEHQFTVTFVEGTTLKEWLIEIEQQSFIEKTLSGNKTKQIIDTLGIAQENPEGWFFPDTYAFTSGTKDIELLERAYIKMKSMLEQQWHSRALNLPYTQPYQALIMASIIEKETGKLSEQSRISSVFVNRLNKKMRLQTDPTVIYGLGERYQGDITRAHLKEKTAYNTYRINGLPPTPIAMPGLSAIEAALNPEQSDYYYFVSMGNGAHKFSKTLAEHNAAVSQYQLNK
jgi:peptidoglycan lytic transglycosylase G